MKKEKNIPLLDCPVDFLVGDATGKLLNEYGRFPCKIKCGVYALIIQGNAKATINVAKYDFKKGDFLFLEPNSFLLIHEFSEDALVLYVIFSSAFLEKNHFTDKITFDGLLFRDPITHLNDEHAAVMEDMYRLMIKASNTTPISLNSEKMIPIFSLLHVTYSSYVKSSDEYIIRTQNRRTQMYYDYTRLVLENYSRWHHVSQYAEVLHVTLPHLCSTVKRISNKTAGDIINDAILMDAKAQLKITNLQVKEIALALGFDNVAFFNRFFKTHTGYTPREYRQNG